MYNALRLLPPPPPSSLLLHPYQINLPELLSGRFNHSLLTFAPELRNTRLFTDGLALLPPSVVAKLPPLVLVLDNDVVLEYTPEDYLPVLKMGKEDGSSGGSSSTTEEDDNGSSSSSSSSSSNGMEMRQLLVVPYQRFMIGQPGLQRKYLEFDREKKRLGIAAARPMCMPESEE